MIKGIKWFFGIFTAIVVVAILFGVLFMLINRWHNKNELVGYREYRFRQDGQDMPWRNAPQQGTPLNPYPRNRMPMHPVWGTPLARMAGVGPLAMFFLCAIGIGFIILLVVGITYLIRPKSPAHLIAASPVVVPPPSQPMCSARDR